MRITKIGASAYTDHGVRLSLLRNDEELCQYFQAVDCLANNAQRVNFWVEGWRSASTSESKATWINEFAFQATTALWSPLLSEEEYILLFDMIMTPVYPQPICGKSRWPETRPFYRGRAGMIPCRCWFLLVPSRSRPHLHHQFLNVPLLERMLLVPLWMTFPLLYLLHHFHHPRSMVASQRIRMRLQR